MTTPLITVCMPTYEPQPHLLKAAIECVLAQTETRWTLFIHDDASQSDVRAIVEPYLKDSRIRFARSEKRLGIGGNWNACMQTVETPYVQYLFQDDLWDKDYVASGVKILEQHPKVGFVSLEHEYLFDGTITDHTGYDALLAFKQENISEGEHEGRAFLDWWVARGLHPNVIGEPSFVCMRTSATKAAGLFLEDMPQFLDAEYWTRLLLVSDWYAIKESHGAFLVHSSGASTQNEKLGRGLFDRLRSMEMVMNRLEGSSRAIARKAIAAQLADMMQKYVNRRKAGKTINPEGSGTAKQFLIKHPILAFRGLLILLSTYAKY
jgi:glycosyltransferase involved in cell wall biosynthesis